MEKRKLMASFVLRTKFKEFSDHLFKNEITDKIFMLSSESQKNVYIFTYNLNKDIKLENLKEKGAFTTMTIQREKEHNVLFTINALNILLQDEKMKTEEEDTRKIAIDWSRYENSILSTTPEKELHISKTEIVKVLTKEVYDKHKDQSDFVEQH
jgi:hypothetical protein